MENLKNMKNTLVSCAQAQMTDLKNTDAKELGEVIDMIKDLEEAMYYCTITKAMNEKDKEEPKYYTEPLIYRYPDPPVMYYGGGRGQMSQGGSSSSQTGTPAYYGGEREYPMVMDMRDEREGKSPMSRKNYMESKQMHKDSATQMKDLEKYMKELSEDITEMIADATPEEKQMLQQKVTMLANKIK